MIVADTNSCQRCGYRWRPLVDNPRVCPRCKQDWDTPRKRPYKTREQKKDSR